MSLLVVGTVAYDTVVTSAGSRKDSLGGSATYFSVSSSYFSPVSIVAVVGEDFQDDHIALLKSHDIDVSGLAKQTGKTFRWSGVYSAEDVNARSTLDTQLNVFADFTPVLSSRNKKARYVFLANMDPDLQLQVIKQMNQRPKLIALDTMNYWIERKNSSLRRVVKEIDVLMLDEREARDFSSEINLPRAAKHIMSLGPKTVIIKRGDHGVMLFNDDKIFAAPAFPVETVADPTGAGDSFAGGFMGYLASTGDLSNAGFRQATVVASIMGSFAVESFSLERLCSLTRTDFETRLQAFTEISHFKTISGKKAMPWRKAI